MQMLLQCENVNALKSIKYYVRNKKKIFYKYKLIFWLRYNIVLFNALTFVLSYCKSICNFLKTCKKIMKTTKLNSIGKSTL